MAKELFFRPFPSKNRATGRTKNNQTSIGDASPMRRTLSLGVFFGVLLALGAPPADGGKKEKDPVKAALQEFNDFIGEWKGSGTVPDDKFLIWTENADWSWRFKGKDSWLEMKVPNGK